MLLGVFQKAHQKSSWKESRVEKKIVARASPTRTTRITRQNKFPSLVKPSVRGATPNMIPSPDKEVWVVGGGPSLRDFNFSKLTDKHTITINKSVFYVPDPNYFVTVDYTFLHKGDISRFRSINTLKIFVIDFSTGSLREQNGRIVDTKFNIIYRLQDFSVIVKSYKDKGIGYAFDDFRTGGNSGFCGLQLAVILGYRKIYLLGFDLKITNETHFHEGYSKPRKEFEEKLDLYYSYFDSGIKALHKEYPEVEVFSCSPISKLNQFIPYVNIDRVLDL